MGRRTAGALVLAVLWAVVVVPPASACSCAGRSLRQVLAGPGTAAVVVTRVDQPPDALGARMRLRVEHALGAAIGGIIEAVPGNGGDCSPVVMPGSVAALAVERREGGWQPQVCGDLDLGDVLGAVGALEEATSAGPAVLVAAGTFGQGRTLATLDALGVPVAWGEGPAPPQAVTVCPGGDRLIEVVADRASLALVVRDLPGLAVQRSVVLGPAGQQVVEVRCDDAGASGAVLLTLRQPDAHARLGVWRVHGDDVEVVAEVLGAVGALGDGLAVVVEQSGDFEHADRSERLLAIDIGTGAVHVVRGLADSWTHEVTVAPAGDRVALTAATRSGDGPAHLVVLDAASGDVVARRALQRDTRVWDLWWEGADALVAGTESLPHGTSVRFRSDDLQVVGSWPLPSHSPAVVVGDAAYAAGGLPLTAWPAGARQGPGTPIGPLVLAATTHLLAVPGAAGVAPPAPAAAPATADASPAAEGGVAGGSRWPVGLAIALAVTGALVGAVAWRRRSGP